MFGEETGCSTDFYKLGLLLMGDVISGCDAHDLLKLINLFNIGIRIKIMMAWPIFNLSWSNSLGKCSVFAALV